MLFKFNEPKDNKMQLVLLKSKTSIGIIIIGQFKETSKYKLVWVNFPTKTLS